MSVDTTTRKDIKCIRTVAGTDTDMTYLADLPETPTEDDVLKYTVDINDDGIGGTVTVAYASTSATITIYRDTTDKQESSYEDYNQFPASTVESDFDKRTLVTQEMSETLDRTLKVPITSDVSSELPTPEADAFIGWNDAGDALENKEIPDPSTLVRATKDDAEAGTNNEKFMTPLRTKEAIDELQDDDIPITYVSTDGTLADNSDTKIATQKAVKTYADTKTIAPATNTADKVPQWNGADSKTLKDGLTVGTGASNLVQLDGDSKLPAVDGSALTGISVLSNVIFCWHGADSGGTNTRGWYSGTDLKKDFHDYTETYNYFGVHRGTNRTILTSKFKKISGISTITINARLWARTSLADKEAILTVNVGGQSNTVKSVTSDTPSWVTASDIDVSSLSNGTTYNITISLKNEHASYSAYCSAVILIAS